MSDPNWPDWPLADVVTAMKRADVPACFEFVCRQDPAHWQALHDGAVALGRIAHKLECEDPETLMAWKFPEVYEPVPGDVLPNALEAAVIGDLGACESELRELSFYYLMVVSSVASQLRLASREVLRSGTNYWKPNPQQVLFTE